MFLYGVNCEIESFSIVKKESFYTIKDRSNEFYANSDFKLLLYQKQKKIVHCSST